MRYAAASEDGPEPLSERRGFGSVTPVPSPRRAPKRSGSRPVPRPRQDEPSVRTGVADAPVAERELGARFAELYERWFGFVWRTARRLGVAEDDIDDVVQEIFLVVHRQLPGFEGRSSIKTWLFGITRRVARDHRRARQRRRPQESLRDSWVGAPRETEPMHRACRAEDARLLHSLLDSLDDDKREVFVLAELEQMTSPEIAEALGIKLNTVYSRLRAARRGFEKAVQRHRARERRRQP